MVILWGEDGVMLCNDGYAVVAGSRFPRIIGSRVRESSPEVASFNDNVLHVRLAGGTLAYRDEPMTLLRDGRPEQVWLSLDYSPIVDETGVPQGDLAIVSETTAKVRAERKVHDAHERLSLDEAPADLCIIDVRLPDMTGIELFRSIRARFPEMPVLFATGHARLPEIDGEPRTITLPKPYDEHTLIAAVDRLWGRR